MTDTERIAQEIEQRKITNAIKNGVLAANEVLNEDDRIDSAEVRHVRLNCVCGEGFEIHEGKPRCTECHEPGTETRTELDL